MLKSTAALVLASVIVLPALAQAPSSGRTGAGASGASATTGNATAGNTAPDRNHVMTDISGMRTSRIIGASVYNEHDDKVGSIDDLIIDNDRSLNVVLSVGGFLGIGSKLVEVPFDKLQFASAKGSSDNRVIMPGMTKEALNGMPDFHYVNRS